MKKTIFQNLTLVLLVALVSSATISLGAEALLPIADAGLPRYAGPDPVVLEGTGSYDPDNSGTLSYTWRQISGPSVIIIDANTATPTIAGSMVPGEGRNSTPKPGGFTQTDEIQECEFELVVSGGELTSLPDNVKVIIVPDFGTNSYRLENPLFDADKPTIIHFGGGDGTNGLAGDGVPLFTSDAWLSRANIIDFPHGYTPDSGGGTRTYYKYGDMVIVYLSAVAPDYKQPIQTIGWSTGGQPAMDVGIHLNRVYRDARYAVNHVTHIDPPCRISPQWGGSWELYTQIAESFLTSSVDGEQCWIDFYYGHSGYAFEPLPRSDILWVRSGLDHSQIRDWYRDSLTGNDMNNFNGGIIAGAYWSVIGPGKNLQLAPDTYYFQWNGGTQSGSMNLYDEAQYPGRLPEPVTLVGPEDGSFVDANGAVFSCEASENAIGYQLLFGSDPYRVMDYHIVSDTSSPPTEIVTSFPFEQTWWTIKVRDRYGSTIYADPLKVIADNVTPFVRKIENITLGKGYNSIQAAIDDAITGDEIVFMEGIYYGSIDFKGKSLVIRSINPDDPTVVAATVIDATNHDSGVIFSGIEDADCVLAGFTITGAKRGIYCFSASPTITNCTITGNIGSDMGAGMFIKDGSNPTLANCIFSSNSASMMGGGIYTENSNPILINCTFAANSATYFGGGIYCSGGSPVLTNCILWSDAPDEISMFIGTPMITYSDIQGGFTGEGNIDADPLFVDAANGDYHLLTGSPCIDAGDTNSEFALEPEPNGGRINMGAYGGTPQATLSQ